MQTLIEKTTAQCESRIIKNGTDSGYHTPTTGITLYLLGGPLGAEESVKIQYPDGQDWRDCKRDGNVLALTEDDTPMSIYRPMEFRVVKSTTIAPVGVGVGRLTGV